MHSFSHNLILLALTVAVTVALDLGLKRIWRKRKHHERKQH